MTSALLRGLTRSLYLTSRTSLALARPAAQLLRSQPAKSASFARFASNSPVADEASVAKLVGKLNENPEIREILEQFQVLLVSKGLNPEKPPSMMEVMRLFADKEVRELAGKLKAKFDDAGIQISPDQMSLFMGMFKK
ncbi:hypothetical protein METSCH_E03790 [Metschnikowia aff. pulcherrima]|uniref:Uncharacterized protein n=1 Tax=Metschnikowia aff. pulcherrima TaxID=2163413 RepID=A0A4P6XSP0_9ASCO|nr:hypothetical protein METSCH_E03790 [Metschnikowia aff. pulcherrima]